MIIAQTPDEPQLVTPSQATLSKSVLALVAAAQSKPSFDRDTKMSHHIDVEQKDDENLKQECKGEV